MTHFQPMGQPGALGRAKQQLQQSNARFLHEIGQLAEELEQKSTSPAVRQLAAQIMQYCSQIQSNEQSEQQL